KPKRSLDQNARLWILHELAAKRLTELQMQMVERLIDAAPEDGAVDPAALLALKHPWTKDACHDVIFKPRFCGGKSSTRLSKMEMVDAQTEYEVWLAEIGVEFSQQPETG